MRWQPCDQNLSFRDTWHWLPREEEEELALLLMNTTKYTCRRMARFDYLAQPDTVFFPLFHVTMLMYLYIGRELVDRA